jgi:hypothetical protein
MVEHVLLYYIVKYVEKRERLKCRVIEVGGGVGRDFERWRRVY